MCLYLYICACEDNLCKRVLSDSYSQVSCIRISSFIMEVESAIIGYSLLSLFLTKDDRLGSG